MDDGSSSNSLPPFSSLIDFTSSNTTREEENPKTKKRKKGTKEREEVPDVYKSLNPPIQNPLSTTTSYIQPRNIYSPITTSTTTTTTSFSTSLATPSQSVGIQYDRSYKTPQNPYISTRGQETFTGSGRDVNELNMPNPQEHYTSFNPMPHNNPNYYSTPLSRFSTIPPYPQPPHPAYPQTAAFIPTQIPHNTNYPFQHPSSFDERYQQLHYNPSQSHPQSNIERFSPPSVSAPVMGTTRFRQDKNMSSSPRTALSRTGSNISLISTEKERENDKRERTNTAPVKFETTTNTTSTIRHLPSQSATSTSKPQTPAAFCRFVLKEQPYPKQRKSYSNENRYLLPNPIVLYAITKIPSTDPSKTITLPKIISGSVTVSLEDEFGNEMPTSSLQSSTGRVTEQLTNDNLSVQFSIKITEHSGDRRYVLHFWILYETENGERLSEIVKSDPFYVVSNKAFVQKVPPVAIDLMPKSGKHEKETEVWIKGSQFRKRGIVVKFGQMHGRVVQVSRDLITVFAPKRPDLSTDTLVEVEVSNNHKNTIFKSPNKLEYLYLVRPIKKNQQ